MKRLSLRVSVPLAVSLMMTLVVGSGLYSAWQSSLRQLDASAQSLLRAELYRLARQAGEHGRAEPVDLWRDISQTATHPLVREVALIDRRGRVLQAHRRAWVGQPATAVVHGWNPLRLADQLGQRDVTTGWDETRNQLSGMLTYLQPVFDPGAERQLDPAVVYVRLDVGRARDDLAVAALRGRGPDLLMVLALLLLLALWLHRAVTRPLNALQRTSTLWADGHLTARADERGPAEIARLAQGFNQMAGALQTSQGELMASKEHLSTVLYSTGDALLAADTRQRITLLNPTAERLTGWREHEARGRTVAEVFRIEHAHTGKPAEIPVQQVLDTGLVVGLANHTVLVSRQGNRTHIADSAAPVRDGTGALHGVVLVFRDVSESYRLEQALAESEHHYRALANTGKALKCTTDAEGRGIWCNNAWLAFTGLTETAALATDWLQAVHPDDFESALFAWRSAVEADQAFEVVLRMRRHDGEYRWMLVEGMPRVGPTGLRQGCVLLAVDITHEREADQRMLTQLDELRRWQTAVVGREERIVALKAEVNTLLASLDQAARYSVSGGGGMSDPVGARADAQAEPEPGPTLSTLPP